MYTLYSLYIVQGSILYSIYITAEISGGIQHVQGIILYNSIYITAVISGGIQPVHYLPVVYLTGLYSPVVYLTGLYSPVV